MDKRLKTKSEKCQQVIENKTHTKYNSPFAPSGSTYLNFKLPVESNPQAQPLQDVFLYP
jgi:hypothetical protein